MNTYPAKQTKTFAKTNGMLVKIDLEFARLHFKPNLNDTEQKLHEGTWRNPKWLFLVAGLDKLSRRMRATNLNFSN